MFGFELLVATQTELGVHVPLFVVGCGVGYQLVDDLTLSIFNVVKLIEFPRKSLNFSTLLLLEACFNFSFALLLQLVELSDDVRWQAVPLAITDSSHETVLEFLLQEDVEFSLKFGFHF